MKKTPQLCNKYIKAMFEARKDREIYNFGFRESNTNQNKIAYEFLKYRTCGYYHEINKISEFSCKENRKRK